jgi:hypothetical protein
MGEFRKDANKKFAPIALFAYNRPFHLRKVVESILTNRESKFSELFVFIDGPRNHQDVAKINEIENFLNRLEGFSRCIFYTSKFNLGLEKSITSGVSKILSKHEDIIVIEDDIVVSSNFLEFMNEGLKLYKNEEDVASIHGYVYPVKRDLPETFFLRGADCWGWATWKRAWEKYESDATRLLYNLKRQGDIDLFNYSGHSHYLQMLESSASKKLNSWAIKWYASMFLEKKYTLYPGKSLVKNIGNDGSGTNSGITKRFDQKLSKTKINLKKIPIEESPMARSEFEKFFKKFNNNNLLVRILQRIKQKPNYR